uniref:Uncharacterized protein n=1 Tax=Tanacetum cinerariifolium TaxID=118510 RepID=A0A6L2N7B8_TANCI|nr:hypothetical protein [Tanacetum cinerariifolium]
MNKSIALIAKYFKNIYKPTNNNLRTSSNTMTKNVDPTQRYEDDRNTRQFGNQRTMTVAGVKETVDDEYNVFANDHEHTDQPENMNDTFVMEKVDSNTTPNSSDLCNNEFKDDRNVDDDEDECVVLANLIANLKLNIDENKKIQKQSRKANATLTHEMNEHKYALKESNDIRDRCRNTLNHPFKSTYSHKT